MFSKGIRSTRTADVEDEPEPHPEPITEPTSNIHDVFVYCFENPLYDDRNTISVDLPGRYPDTSFLDTRISMSCMIQSPITSMPRDSRRDEHLN